ncbi:hypothetical protein PIB30_114373, partial [Stylosanthes scabra]|nr:hypothetical protein [Stylosanthes scabra]
FENNPQIPSSILAVSTKLLRETQRYPTCVPATEPENSNPKVTATADEPKFKFGNNSYSIGDQAGEDNDGWEKVRGKGKGKLNHASKVNRATASQAKMNTPGKPIRLKVNGPKATQGPLFKSGFPSQAPSSFSGMKSVSANLFSTPSFAHPHKRPRPPSLQNSP